MRTELINYPPPSFKIFGSATDRKPWGLAYSLSIVSTSTPSSSVYLLCVLWAMSPEIHCIELKWSNQMVETMSETINAGHSAYYFAHSLVLCVERCLTVLLKSCRDIPLAFYSHHFVPTRSRDTWA